MSNPSIQTQVEDAIKNIGALLPLVEDKVRSDYEAKKTKMGDNIFAPSYPDKENNPALLEVERITTGIRILKRRVEERGDGYAQVEAEEVLRFEEEAKKLYQENKAPNANINPIVRFCGKAIDGTVKLVLGTLEAFFRTPF